MAKFDQFQHVENDEYQEKHPLDEFLQDCSPYRVIQDFIITVIKDKSKIEKNKGDKVEIIFREQTGSVFCIV